MAQGKRWSDEFLDSVIGFIRERGEVRPKDLGKRFNIDQRGIINKLLKDNKIQKVQKVERFKQTVGVFAGRSCIRRINYYRVIDTS